MEIKTLIDIDNEDPMAYYVEGHIDKLEFIEMLKDEDMVGMDEEFSPDEIFHKYAKWIVNPHYEEDDPILDERLTPREGYFPITIYDFA